LSGTKALIPTTKKNSSKVHMMERSNNQKKKRKKTTMKVSELSISSSAKVPTTKAMTPKTKRLI
jgi:hypothetical protein